MIPSPERLAVPQERSGTLSALLAHQARVRPGDRALADGHRSLSYQELDATAGRLAARLVDLGVRRGDRVALLGPRDARILTLLHGVFRAGAVAVPLDPGWGPRDVRRRLDSVGARHVVTTTATCHVPEPYRAVLIDADSLPGLRPKASWPTPCAPEDLAYLSFTSGSTGEPRAVAVTHANAVHYATALTERLYPGEKDPPCVAHVTTLAADLGHSAWLLALASGGSVHVLPDDDARDPEAFWRRTARAGVTAVKTTPSHLTALLPGRPPDSPPLHTLLLGGEPLSRVLAGRVLEEGVSSRVVNHYGPTETTVGAACFLAASVADLPADEPVVPIGTALGDNELSLLPDGELLIGGSGLTAGYFARPEETARHFVDFGGRPVYRTGDRCRRRPDGNLVFLGRRDRQCKVRGFRVDLDGVERLVESLPGVDRCVVLARATDSGRRLAAAVRFTAGIDDERELAKMRRQLPDLLPDHAVPRPVIVLADMPFGPNGKLDRAQVEDRILHFVEERGRSGRIPGSSAPGGEPGAGTRGGSGGGAGSGTGGAGLVQEVAAMWAASLGLPVVEPGSDVLELGGDSILAMTTVGLLRRHGLPASFRDFYDHPTADALVSALRTRSPAPLADVRTSPPRRPAPAQRWFFQQSLDEAGHWNQSVLLRCETRVSPPALAAAVSAVLDRHSVLRRPLGPEGPAPRPVPVADSDVTSRSLLPDADALRERLGPLCTELHRSLDPRSGRLLRVHLFSGGPGVDDRIALIAHHLVVDGLSWRVLLDDLVTAYRAVSAGKPPGLAPAADFYDWAAALPGPAPETVGSAPGTLPRLPAGGEGVRRPATLLWSLDEQGTRRLVERHGRGRRLEAVLLTEFADAMARWTGERRLAVEVETHGRDTGDDGTYLDSVGWFTAVKWITVQAGCSPEETEELLGRAAVLPMDTAGKRPETAFNYLGSFGTSALRSVGWAVAPEQAGAARCTAGDTLYGIRLTARVVEERLVADLVYARPQIGDGDAERVLAAFARGVAGRAEAAAGPCVRSGLSSSGHPLHTGNPAVPARVSVLREPLPVLLTGATGYLGGHLLTALTERGARVTCLVRGENEAHAARRLAGADVVAGDIESEELGLSATGLARLSSIRAVVHAAADVRLVAPPGDLERTNHHAVRRLLSWMDARLPDAVLHHVSTLAVSGEAPGGPPRRFSEADLRIGQRFRTPYEESKFRAEEAVRAWAAAGGQAFIHRTGHVAAHSRSGEFQSNAGDNRIHQILHGYVLAGVAPSRPATAFTFSHVDTVARGIAAVATSGHSAPGVYHVESPFQVAHDDLVGWLNLHGHHVRLADHAVFESALAELEQREPTAARLAAGWSRLGDRNVVYDSAWTTAVLDRLGVRFTEPTARWWSRVLDRAVATGALPVPAGPRI